MKKTNIFILKKGFLSFFTVLILTQIACVPFVELRKNFNDLKSSHNPKKVSASEFNLKSASDVAQKEIYKILTAKDFNSIEKIANEARIKKERLAGGYWKLDAVYEALTNIFAEYPGQEVTDELWINRIELLKKWKENSPESITARVALAKVYIEYGWFARGSGYINTVSREDYRFLHERLDMAEKELLEAKELNVKCPRWYREMLSLGISKGWSRNEFEELYDEAVKFEPNYLQFYLVKSEYLTPKWNGKEGDWQRFVDSLPSKLSTLETDETDIIYFVVVVNKIKDPSLHINFAMLSRERIKQGFVDLDKKYQADNMRLNQFAYISTLDGDYSAAQDAFRRIENDWNKEVWSEQEFKAMKQIANKLKAGNY